MEKITRNQVEEFVEKMNNFRDVGEDSFVVRTSKNIASELGDAENLCSLPLDKYEKIQNEGCYIVFNMENRELEYFLLDEYSKIQEKFPNIAKTKNNIKARIERITFSILDTEFNKAVLCKIYREKIGSDFSPYNKIVSRDISNFFEEKWILFFSNGQIFTNLPGYKEGTFSLGLINEIASNVKVHYYYRHFLINSVENMEVHKYSWDEIYNLYFSKICPKICYVAGSFVNIKNLQALEFFKDIIAYKEPSVKNSKNQKLITELSQKSFIKNEISEKIQKEIYENKSKRQSEQAVIDKVDTKEDVSVIRRFFQGEKKDHARLYFFKDKDVIPAFRNRRDEWVVYSSSTRNAKKFSFNLKDFEKYDNNILDGTLLGFIKPIVERLESNNESNSVGEIIYSITKNHANEEFFKTKYAQEIVPDYISPTIAEDIFGQTNDKAKGFFQKVGLNRDQLDLIYNLSIKLDKEMPEYKKEDFIKEDNYIWTWGYGDNVNFKFVCFLKIIHIIKELLSGPDHAYTSARFNFLDISSVDISTFKKGLNILEKAIAKNNSNQSFGSYIYNITSSSNLFKRNYSLTSFPLFLDFIHDIMLETINGMDNDHGENIEISNYAISYYNDYLDMLNLSHECENFPWKFKNKEEVIKAHDDFIPIFNRYKNFRGNPRVINQKVEELHEKWKNYEYNDEKFLIRYPKNADEILDEGRSLKHCVASFVNSVVNQTTNIFFIRKVDDPDNPFFTLELKNNQIRQVHGSCNRNVATEEDLSDFIKKWADKNNFIYNVQKAERMLA